MDLQKRMSLFTTGQATWPDPDKHKNARCTECRQYAPHLDRDNKPTDKGRCIYVRALTGKPGMLFEGQRALACGKFERGQA